MDTKIAKTIGITFGGYCPLHQGHLDLIMDAKKHNDITVVVICGYDGEERGEAYGLPLTKREELVRQFFEGDELIRVITVNDTELGIDESMSEGNWDVWLKHVYEKINLHPDIVYDTDTRFTWYVGEDSYDKALWKRRYEYGNFIAGVVAYPRSDVSGTKIRKNPLAHWNEIAWTFRPYFTKKILITGTASEGKSTITKDIANYFGCPYVEEWGRTVMAELGISDPEITKLVFENFITKQSLDLKIKTLDRYTNNCGVIVSDTDNLVTLMYAKAYSQDPDCKVTEDDYQDLYNQVKNRKSVDWDKIYLLPPKNDFVDDGTRYMKQASIEERQKNYDNLVELLKEFGYWDKVEILDGTFYSNYIKVQSYIKSLYKENEEV